MNSQDTWVALVHHPVYDRTQRVVSTAITNLDLHDIARSSRTYGLAGFIVVHPVAAQRELAERIADHWRKDGAELNEFRRQAIEIMHVVSTLEEARQKVADRVGRPPLVVSTAARKGDIGAPMGFSELRRVTGPTLLVLGTGWGLTDELLATCDRRLAPVMAGAPYNHLSVRSACAIILDRLLGDHEDYAP